MAIGGGALWNDGILRGTNLHFEKNEGAVGFWPFPLLHEITCASCCRCTHSLVLIPLATARGWGCASGQRADHSERVHVCQQQGGGG